MEANLADTYLLELFESSSTTIFNMVSQDNWETSTDKNPLYIIR